MGHSLHMKFAGSGCSGSCRERDDVFRLLLAPVLRRSRSNWHGSRSFPSTVGSIVTLGAQYLGIIEDVDHRDAVRDEFEESRLCGGESCRPSAIESLRTGRLSAWWWGL